jgi:mono/diheme cytochrome c family protein
MFAALATAGAQTPQASTSPDAPAQQRAEADPAVVDPARIGQGKTTYAEKCSHCHGFGMVTAGTVAPDLRKFPHDQTRFVTTVKLGKNNRMPPWGDLLSDDQIESLWTYVSSQRKP